MRHLLPALLLLLAASACAPDDIATSRCESVMLAIGDPWSCTVKADVVGRSSAIRFDTESRNRIAKVDIALQVAHGKLRLDYDDLNGAQHLLITPSEPATLSMQTRMHPEKRSFTLTFTPVDGNVQGLAGTVKYSTP